MPREVDDQLARLAAQAAPQGVILGQHRPPLVAPRRCCAVVPLEFLADMLGLPGDQYEAVAVDVAPMANALSIVFVTDDERVPVTPPGGQPVLLTDVLHGGA